MTVGELVDKTIANKEDFGFYLRNFLDDFYALDQEDRQKVLISPVRYHENYRRELSFIAAAVEKLADDYGLAEPEAVLLLGQVLEARCTQFVDSEYTYVAKVRREYLPARGPR